MRETFYVLNVTLSLILARQVETPVNRKRFKSQTSAGASQDSGKPSASAVKVGRRILRRQRMKARESSSLEKKTGSVAESIHPRKSAV